MEISGSTAVRYSLAFVGGLPAATVFAVFVGLCFGEKNLPGDDWIILASLVVGWAVATIWAGLATDVRQLFRRACQLFSGGAILLPVAALVFAITEPPSDNPIFSKTLIFFFFLAVGAVMAAMGWLLASYIPRLEGVKFGVVVGALTALVTAIMVSMLLGIVYGGPLGFLRVLFTAVAIVSGLLILPLL